MSKMQGTVQMCQARKAAKLGICCVSRRAHRWLLALVPNSRSEATHMTEGPTCEAAALGAPGHAARAAASGAVAVEQRRPRIRLRLQQRWGVHAKP